MARLLRGAGDQPGIELDVTAGLPAPRVILRHGVGHQPLPGIGATVGVDGGVELYSWQRRTALTQD